MAARRARGLAGSADPHRRRCLRAARSRGRRRARHLEANNFLVDHGAYDRPLGDLVVGHIQRVVLVRGYLALSS